MHPRNRVYLFSEVEQALAAMHGIDDAALLAFRGRIHHLQKLGLIPSAPGRGQKPRYSFEDVAIWAFCVELIEIGLAPGVISRIVKRLWNGILYCFVEGASWEDDCLLIFQPKMLSSSFPDDVELSDKSILRILHGPELSGDVLREMGGRVIAINVSDLHRRMVAAIERNKPGAE